MPESLLQKGYKHTTAMETFKIAVILLKSIC